MTIEEAIKMLVRLKERINFEVTDAQAKMDALNMAIKALEENQNKIGMESEYFRNEFNNDYISREAVQDLINTWLNDYLTEETREVLEVINGKVGNMPSVQPTRPKGRWLHPYKSDVACECSICHRQMPIGYDYHFCPVCGADMRESDKE